MRRVVLGLILTLACATHASAQRATNTSGGVLSAEQAAYDVRHYDLALEVFPETKSIDGRLTVTADVVDAMETLVLDLDPKLTVHSATEGAQDLSVTRNEGELRIGLGSSREPGSTVRVAIRFGGTPRVAPNPPWDGGFTWAKTPGGAHWIATSCQMNGADLWWPCKDHPSDKPDSMDLHITVPQPLVCASNGKLVGTDLLGETKRTDHWHVSTPIQNYGVALNIAPYVVLERAYTSTAGDDFPVFFWVLPSHVKKGEAFMEEIVQHLRFFEETCGPYPFRADKYGVAETPHLGMEHQTIIAYGNKFKPDPYGYDWLHHHELAHEWWANLVTCADWNDFWIHEGFGTYCQALYTEQRDGPEGYHKRMAQNGRSFSNARPIAPREVKDTAVSYSGDIYYKGAWVLHSLRYVMGDAPFFKAFRRMAYPDPAMEQVTDGSHIRFATTDEFLALCEEESKQELDWFFEVYLRQADLPTLERTTEDGVLHLTWKTPNDLPFPMPITVDLDGTLHTLPMSDGKGTLALSGKTPRVDPDHWVLRKLERRTRRGR